jgi:polysaccharide biosynthesis/export protein
MKDQVRMVEGVMYWVRISAVVFLLTCSAGLFGCGISFSRNAEAGLADAPAPNGDSVTASGTQPLTRVADKFISASSPGNSAYRIGPLDVLDISVFKVPELSKSVQVADSGSINLPLVGEIQASGKTAQDIERDLTAILGTKYLRNPQVTVYVKEYNSQRVTIEGAVKKPGVYPIKGKTSLLQVIAMAESPDKESASSTVVVFRTVDGKRSAARFDIDEIRHGKAEDPIIQQGDVIFVDTSTSKVVFNNFLRVLPTAAAFVPLL